MGLIYREIIEGIIYVHVADRPDISYAVPELSKFGESPDAC